jgi:hypothetical protein
VIQGQKKRRRKILEVFTYFGFWFEIFILALIPYPRLTNIFAGKFTMTTVNWMDPGSFIQPPGSMMV